MARNPYNGYTPAERTAAGQWIKQQRARGLRAPHTTCQVCHRRGGTVKGHSENYSAPYGPHIGEHGLCYPCHMAVHARFKHPDAFQRYAHHMREGRQYPDTANYTEWIRLFLAQRHMPPVINPPRDTTWLDTLPLTEADAIAKHNPHRLTPNEPDHTLF